jgi:hypothetical protein
MEVLLDLAILASEEFVPPNDWRAQIAFPVGALFLLGGVYLLLRSNLGTRRAYFVWATSFFGFMLLISLFWAFGGPGTPMYTGPQNLPGQPIDYYQPKWVPFAEDSVVAEQPAYQAVQGFPDTFGPVPDGQASLAEDGAGPIQDFFASDAAGAQVGEGWIAEETWYAEAENGRPMIAVQYTEPLEDAPLEPDPDGESYVAFGFYQSGNLMFPNLVFIVLSLIGFVLHMLLLGWDERQERRDLEEDLAAERERQERVPTPA